jgi:hypothetical protein
MVYRKILPAVAATVGLGSPALGAAPQNPWASNIVTPSAKPSAVTPPKLTPWQQELAAGVVAPLPPGSEEPKLISRDNGILFSTRDSLIMVDTSGQETRFMRDGSLAEVYQNGNLQRQVLFSPDGARTVTDYPGKFLDPYPGPGIQIDQMSLRVDANKMVTISINGKKYKPAPQIPADNVMRNANSLAKAGSEVMEWEKSALAKAAAAAQPSPTKRGHAAARP